MEQFSRTEALLGAEALQKLGAARVAVFGIGGVGGYTAEALARSGIGYFDLIDDDLICLTNLNRQIIALHSTVGRPKVEVMAERIRDINPNAKVMTHRCFFMPENAAGFDFASYDYVVDAIDTVTAKIELIRAAKEAGTPVISCMGAGNKLDPTKFEVADISKTSVCPLAKVMRKELRLRGIDHVKVVYSKEPPVETQIDLKAHCTEHCVCPPAAERTCTSRRSVPGSISFCPSVAGLIMAGEVIKDLAL